MRSYERVFNQRGEVLLEAVIALTLLTVVVFGLGQQFAVVNAQLEHQKIATEVLLGPQEASLVFKDEPSSFAPLDATSSPTLGNFLKNIADFAASRASDSTSVAVSLGYLSINVTTGVVSGKVDPTSFIFEGGTRASRCVQEDAEDELTSSSTDGFATEQLGKMLSYTVPNRGAVPVGAKLYDVKVGGERYQGFIDYLPFIFLWVCSEPTLGPLTSPPTSMFTIVPRRLVD